MAASQPSLGMQHLTVVPTNFEPPTGGDESDDDSDAEAVDAAEIATDAVDTAANSVDSE